MHIIGFFFACIGIWFLIRFTSRGLIRFGNFLEHTAEGMAYRPRIKKEKYKRTEAVEQVAKAKIIVSPEEKQFKDTIRDEIEEMTK